MPFKRNRRIPDSVKVRYPSVILLSILCNFCQSCIVLKAGILILILRGKVKCQVCERAVLTFFIVAGYDYSIFAFGDFKGNIA